MPTSDFTQSLLLAVIAASLGGILAKRLKLQPIIGYIFSGIVLGSLLPVATDISKLSEVGIILLLFSLGLEFPLSKITKVFRAVLLPSIFQVTLVTVLAFFFFRKLGFSDVAALIFGFGSAMSSTAVIVKVLSDRGETETVHGGLMTAWLLLQDLMAIPAVVLISALTKSSGGWLAISLNSFLKAGYVILTALVFGRIIVPFLIHKVASYNIRELLVLSSLAFAVGIAYLTYLIGISPSFGAFLAGLVLAESAENHAVFAEIRPLRDIFVAIFFVTLGFMVKPAILFGHLFSILGIAVFLIILKIVTNFLVAQIFGKRGKTGVALALGLSQVGEFAFVMYSLAAALGLLQAEQTSIVIAASLMTLLLTPFLFKSIVPLWRQLKIATQKVPFLNKLFLGGERGTEESGSFQDHIIVCGYGRVGAWVGKALFEAGIPLVIVDYNQAVVTDLKKEGLVAIFGDPGEPEVLEAAGIKTAKAVVLAIPDRVSQEALISYVQTVAPQVKIISRVHQDEDWERLKLMKLEKVIQPEFEAAIAISRAILTSMGKPKEEIAERLKKLRISRARS